MPENDPSTEEFMRDKISAGRFAKMERILADTRGEYIATNDRIDKMDGKIDKMAEKMDIIGAVVVRVEATLNERENRCISHTIAIKEAKDLAIEAKRDVENVKSETWPTVFKIIGIYVAILLIGGGFVVTAIKLIPVILAMGATQ